MAQLRDRARGARAEYINAILDAVAFDLESREVIGNYFYWSAERVGVPLAEIRVALRAAHEHAAGTVRIDGLDYPFREPKLVTVLEGAIQAFDTTTLDTPEALVPRNDVHVNFRFGELIEQGVDPTEANRQAQEAVVGHTGRAVPLGTHTVPSEHASRKAGELAGPIQASQATAPPSEGMSRG